MDEMEMNNPEKSVSFAELSLPWAKAGKKMKNSYWWKTTRWQKS